MNSSNANLAKASTGLLKQAADSLAQVILGKDDQNRLALTCLVAQGDPLVEDTTGLGTTSLSHPTPQAMRRAFQGI